MHDNNTSTSTHDSSSNTNVLDRFYKTKKFRHDPIGRHFNGVDLNLVEIIEAIRDQKIDIVQRNISYIRSDHSFCAFPDDSNVDSLDKQVNPHLSEAQGYFLRIEEGVTKRDGKELLFLNDSRYMYILPAYEQMYEMLKNTWDGRDQYLIGTRVGKSFFIYYLVFRCIQEERHFYVTGLRSQQNTITTQDKSIIYSGNYLIYTAKKGTIPFNIGDACIPPQKLLPHPLKHQNLIVTNDNYELPENTDNIDYYMLPTHSDLTFAAFSQCPQLFDNSISYFNISPFLSYSIYSFIGGGLRELYRFLNGTGKYQYLFRVPPSYYIEVVVDKDKYLYTNEEYNSKRFKTLYLPEIDPNCYNRLFDTIDQPTILVSKNVTSHRYYTHVLDFILTNQHILYETDNQPTSLPSDVSSVVCKCDEDELDAVSIKRLIRSEKIKDIVYKGIENAHFIIDSHLIEKYIGILNRVYGCSSY